MKKATLLTLLGCSILTSIAYANITPIKLTTTIGSNPLHTIEFMYPNYDSFYATSSVTIADYHNHQCINPVAVYMPKQSYPANMPIYVNSNDLTEGGLNGDKCISIIVNDFAGTQEDKFYIYYDNAAQIYNKAEPASSIFYLK